MNRSIRAARIVLGLALAILPAWTALPARAAERLDLPADSRLGSVQVGRPTGDVRAFLFLLSDQDGWNAELDKVVDALAADGVAVVGVDLPRWLGKVSAATDDGDCHYLTGDLEDTAKFLQRSWNVPTYRTPVVAGIGDGGTVAYAALADAPAATLDGAVSVDATGTATTRLPICAGAPATPRDGGGFAYGRFDDLPGWWMDARWRRTPPAFPFADDVPSGETVDVGQAPDLAQAMLAALKPALADAGRNEGELADLPIVEVEATGQSQTMAVILSGDGGWRDIDKDIADEFAKRGVPTIGVDSLRYFWEHREPAQVAKDLDRIISHYTAAWKRPRVILVGYSFGADVLPASWQELSKVSRARIGQTSLLALGVLADFEFHVGSWIGWEKSDARPIPPDLATMDVANVQCFYGADEDESDTGCRSPEAMKTERIERPGGHHFDGDYAAIASIILDGAKRRGGGSL